MKNILFGTLILFSVITSQAMATDKCDKSLGLPDIIEISLETSAMVQDERFQQTLMIEKKKLAAEGYTLRIMSFDVLHMSSIPQTYAFATLYKKLAADPAAPWILAGQMTAGVVYASNGEISFDSMYFSPPMSGPGGASVGNH